MSVHTSVVDERGRLRDAQAQLTVLEKTAYSAFHKGGESPCFFLEKKAYSALHEGAKCPCPYEQNALVLTSKMPLSTIYREGFAAQFQSVMFLTPLNCPR